MDLEHSLFCLSQIVQKIREVEMFSILVCELFSLSAELSQFLSEVVGEKVSGS